MLANLIIENTNKKDGGSGEQIWDNSERHLLTARLFDVSDFDVFASIREVLQNNIGDKWWVQKSFDDAPDEEGNMKAKYGMSYKEELKTPKPVMLERQLVLDIRVSKVVGQTSVKLNYQVASVADDVVRRRNGRSH